MNLREKNGVYWFTFDLFAQFDFIVHGFSTRKGGVSKPPFESLNLAFHVGDCNEDVVKNRWLYLNALGLDCSNLTAGEQVHGDIIKVITKKERGLGALDYETALCNTDGFITAEPGVILSSYYADCVPLFIIDPENRVVALAHAGWKGTLLRIGAKTVEKMARFFNSKPENCFAGVGPSIGPCCYEVDEKVIDPLKREFSNWSEFIEKKDNGRWNLNLWKLNEYILLESGIISQNIELSKLCTSCNIDLFFSHRAEKGKTGRMAAIITLKSD